MSSGNLDKYEYLTGEDLNYKPRTVVQAIFHYSPLSKLFSEWLKEEDKKEGPLKRLKIIEDKNEDQLKAIKDRAKKENNWIVKIVKQLSSETLWFMVLRSRRFFFTLLCTKCRNKRFQCLDW